MKVKTLINTAVATKIEIYNKVDERLATIDYFIDPKENGHDKTYYARPCVPSKITNMTVLDFAPTGNFSMRIKTKEV